MTEARYEIIRKDRKEKDLLMRKVTMTDTFLHVPMLSGFAIMTMSELRCRWMQCEDCDILGRNIGTTELLDLGIGWIFGLYQSEDYKWRCVKCGDKYERKMRNERRLERNRAMKKRIKQKMKIPAKGFARRAYAKYCDDGIMMVKGSEGRRSITSAPAM